MEQTTFVVFLVLTAGFTGVCWSLPDIMEAFNSLSPDLQTAFNNLGPNLLPELVKASTCVGEQLKTLNLCNFNTSIDPFYYVQKCLNGTTIQKIVENFVQKVPVANLSFGVPQEVSHDRCDCDKVPLPSCFLQPSTLPPIISPSPISPPPGILGDSKFLR